MGWDLQNPQALIAEVTHRCPLHCVYCSNPRQLKPRSEELSTETWVSVFQQAAEMGVLQLDLTGGEPLARADLVELVAAGRAAKLYVNLITSGIGLRGQRLAALAEAGLDHIQLSFQDAEEVFANIVAGARAHAEKMTVARQLRNYRMAFTVNVVVHRQNLDRLSEMIELAEQLQADRLEIAHVQYYGWALENRSALLPTRLQLQRSLETVEAARKRLKGRMRIEFVLPDYYARFPKPCMGGWGRKLMLVNPSGQVLPCHAAEVIPGIHFDNVCEHPLRRIWEQSSAFCKFRGEEWMPEPCKSCDKRRVDFGGCRCQAFLLAGDAGLTDPVCSLAPAHHIVEAVLARVDSDSQRDGIPVTREDPGHKSEIIRPDWLYRRNPSGDES